jgi:hypothetical protein
MIATLTSKSCTARPDCPHHFATHLVEPRPGGGGMRRPPRDFSYLTGPFSTPGSPPGVLARGRRCGQYRWLPAARPRREAHPVPGLAGEVDKSEIRTMASKVAQYWPDPLPETATAGARGTHINDHSPEGSSRRTGTSSKPWPYRPLPGDRAHRPHAQGERAAVAAAERRPAKACMLLR